MFEWNSGRQGTPSAVCASVRDREVAGPGGWTMWKVWSAPAQGRTRRDGSSGPAARTTAAEAPSGSRAMIGAPDFETKAQQERYSAAMSLHGAYSLQQRARCVTESGRRAGRRAQGFVIALQLPYASCSCPCSADGPHRSPIAVGSRLRDACGCVQPGNFSELRRRLDVWKMPPPREIAVSAVDPDTRIRVNLAP